MPRHKEGKEVHRPDLLIVVRNSTWCWGIMRALEMQRLNSSVGGSFS
jgi:hypothetical protein